MKIIFHPYFKSTFSVFFTFLSGALCSALVNEITKNGKVIVSDISSKKPFFGILIVMIISIIYNIFAAKYEMSFRKNIAAGQYFDDSGILAAAEETKDAIKEGNKDILSNLVEIKDLLRKNNFQDENTDK